MFAAMTLGAPEPKVKTVKDKLFKVKEKAHLYFDIKIYFNMNYC